MKPLLATLLLLLPAAILHAAAPSTGDLINQLADTGAVGYGYSTTFAGSQFLPRPDSGQVGVLILGSHAPTPSPALTALVERGAAAIPALVAHMDDARPTKMKPVSGMMWTAFNDEYDFNRRTHPNAPEGVNRDRLMDDGPSGPRDHQITVGDLCFVALGQIVNRNFSATRYQPTAGMIISSPTYSKPLLAAIRADYATMTPARHRQQLLDDLAEPDSESRRQGAVMRIAYYYPADLDAVVLPQLNVPTYDFRQTYDFVQKTLYPTKSPQKRKALFDAAIQKYGPAERDGVLWVLFHDLDMQIANEQHNLHPPLNERYDARNVLIQLYGYTPAVKPADAPFASTWSAPARADFIAAIGPTTHPAINDAIYRIFQRAKGHAEQDDLALACIKTLAGSGHDPELIAYCKQRIPAAPDSADAYRQALHTLEHSKK
jgi:hypothetical protein